MPDLVLSPVVKSNIVAEMVPSSSNDEVETILDILSASERIESSSIEHITKEDALQIMNKDIDSQLLERVKGDNPFRDIVRFGFKPDISSEEKQLMKQKLSNESSISGIYELDQGSTESGTFLKAMTMKSAIPLTILCLVLYTIYMISLIRSLIVGNKEMFSSFSLYGSKLGFLKNIVHQSTRMETFKGWIVSIFLFILLIYLILGNLDLGFTDISISKIALVIIIPLITTFVIKYIVIENLLSKYLKQL